MSSLKKTALRFIILLGIVSLFADVAYEGARSITGPFLSTLGASGAAVGIIVGIGQLMGYGLRVLTGYLSDKTRQYWAFTIIGYIINLLAVPLLALAGSWQMAGFLIIMERFGKAIRVPARDTMLSYAAKQTGRGFGFGLHESLDQIGAVIGPLMITVCLYFKESYRFSFALLGIPVVLSLATLALARISFPSPHRLEGTQKLSLKTKGLTKKFGVYVLAVGFVAAGFTDFALIAYHFHKAGSVPALWISLLYAIAMGVAGLSALIIGPLYDAKGIPVLSLVTVISALFAPLVFFGHFTGAVIGMILWGIGLGSQESLMRAVVAQLIPVEKRGSAYGVLNLSFGLFWAIGSALMGLFYDISVIYLVLFSIFMQLFSIPLFLRTRAM